MIRNIIASWAFAGFLVVVAVATWRVLDASRPAPAPPPSPALEVATAPPPALPAEVHTCGAGGGMPAYVPVDDAPALVGLQIGTQPYADVTIDGKRYGSTPLYNERRAYVAAGVHTVSLREQETKRVSKWRVVVAADSADNKLVIKLRSHEMKTFGHVGAALVSDSGDRFISEVAAGQRFEGALEALRAGRAQAGCAALAGIAKDASPDGVWRGKADNLFSRRCL